MKQSGIRGLRGTVDPYFATLHTGYNGGWATVFAQALYNNKMAN